VNAADWEDIAIPDLLARRQHEQDKAAAIPLDKLQISAIP
jgi:hypothetical protein